MSKNGILTERQTEIVRLAAAGRTNQQIAFELNISHQTVKNHWTDIYHRLGLVDRTQTVVEAIRLGLVDLAAAYEEMEPVRYGRVRRALARAHELANETGKPHYIISPKRKDNVGRPEVVTRIGIDDCRWGDAPIKRHAITGEPINVEWVVFPGENGRD